MARPLTWLMRSALRKLAEAYDDKRSDAWLSQRYDGFHKNTLYALEERGFVEYDRYLGQVRLTDAGRSAAAELKGDGA